MYDFRGYSIPGPKFFTSSMTFSRYCPYWFFSIGSASSLIFFSSIQPLRYAIPSRHATFSP